MKRKVKKRWWMKERRGFLIRRRYKKKCNKNQWNPMNIEMVVWPIPAIKNAFFALATPLA